MKHPCYRAEIPFVTACPGFGKKRLRMKNWIRICLLIIVLAATGRAAQAASPLPRSALEAHGFSSMSLAGLVIILDQQIDGMHSSRVLCHVSAIAEGHLLTDTRRNE